MEEQCAEELCLVEFWRREIPQYLIRSAVAGLVLLMAMCLGMAAQQARSPSDQVGRIMSLESAWNQAEVQHDTRAMGMLLGETFTYTDSDGSVMNKAEWLDLMRKETDTFEQLGNSKIEVNLYGNVALVTGRYRERVKMKKTSIVRSGRFIDVWIELRGEWKCIGGQATLILPSPAK
jgi:hypothetical protein